MEGLFLQFILDLWLHTTEHVHINNPFKGNSLVTYDLAFIFEFSN